MLLISYLRVLHGNQNTDQYSDQYAASIIIMILVWIHYPKIYTEDMILGEDTFKDQIWDSNWIMKALTSSTDQAMDEFIAIR